jgi:hypothetical protein
MNYYRVGCSHFWCIGYYIQTVQEPGVEDGEEVAIGLCVEGVWRIEREVVASILNAYR